MEKGNKFESSNLDLLHISHQLTNYYGVSCANKRSWYMLIIFLYLWIDYIWSLSLAVLSFVPSDPSTCFYGDIGCMVLFPARTPGTLYMVCCRSVLFLMYNIWFWDKHEWLYVANELFHSLAIPDIQRETIESTKRLMKKAFRVSLPISISYSLFGVILFHYRRWPEIIMLHGQVFFLAYFIGYFLLHSYLFNNVCVELFRGYNKMFEKHLQTRRIDKKLFQTFWTLCLMVDKLKVYLRTFYVVLAFGVFSTTIVAFSAIFYSEMPLNRCIALGLVTMLNLSYLVYFSIYSEGLDIQARELSDIIYKHFNIEYGPKFFGQIFMIQNDQHSKILTLLECLSHNIGLEVMGTPINSATIIQFITVFFSLATLAIR